MFKLDTLQSRSLLISIPFTSPNQTKKKPNEREAGKGILRITFFHGCCFCFSSLVVFCGSAWCDCQTISKRTNFPFWQCSNPAIAKTMCVAVFAEREKKLLVHVNLARQSIKIKIFFACQARSVVYIFELTFDDVSRFIVTKNGRQSAWKSGSGSLATSNGLGAGIKRGGERSAGKLPQLLILQWKYPTSDRNSCIWKWALFHGVYKFVSNYRSQYKW